MLVVNRSIQTNKCGPLPWVSLWASLWVSPCLCKSSSSLAFLVEVLWLFPSSLHHTTQPSGLYKLSFFLLFFSMHFSVVVLSPSPIFFSLYPGSEQPSFGSSLLITSVSLFGIARHPLVLSVRWLKLWKSCGRHCE